MAVLLAGYATFSMIYAVQSLLPELARAFHVPEGSAGLVISMTTGPMAVLILAAGPLADRFGRRPLIILFMAVATLLSLVSAYIPAWKIFLLFRFLLGMTLAGVPAIVMAYIGEEVEPGSTPGAFGLYVAGSGLGSMIGRLGSAITADQIGWRDTLALVAVLAMVATLLFWLLAPRPRAFEPKKPTVRGLVDSTRMLFRDPVIVALYFEAFLMTGSFIAAYNFIGFRLIAPPYSLPSSIAGGIFLLYLSGSVCAVMTGRMINRFGRERVLPGAYAIMSAGALISLASPLLFALLGMAILTIGFFVAHATASGWVAQRGHYQRGHATAFYLSSFYVGSSIVGGTAGIAWHAGHWTGVGLYIFAMMSLAVVVALWIRRRVGTEKPQPLEGEGGIAVG